MPRERARYLLVGLASLATGYALGSFLSSDSVIITDESIGTADYTTWSGYEHEHEHDHDWRSGF